MLEGRGKQELMLVVKKKERLACLLFLTTQGFFFLFHEFGQGKKNVYIFQPLVEIFF